MRRYLFLTLVVILCACGSTTSSPSPASEEPATTNAPPPANAQQLTPQICPAASAHVYHPQRLHLLAGCRTLTVFGRLISAKAEPDGDFHLRLAVDEGQLDPRGGKWINAENTRQQHGALVLEPVCERTISQSDAVAACSGYHNPLAIPAVGSHVAATGFWVFDSAHGWNEFHPLTALTPVQG